MLFSQSNHYYTIQYLLALSIIAILAISTYVIIFYHIQKETDIMPTLKMSSEQKTLSQQIAYWSLEMVLAEEKSEKERWKDTLLVSMRQLNSNYRKLTQDANEMSKNLIQDDKILQMYRSPPLDIDINFQGFLYAILSLLNTPPQEEVTLENKDLKIIQELAAGKLWRGFDEVLKEYNQISSQRIEHVQNMELLVLIVILLVLFLEGLLIFQPMVRTIAQEKQNLLHSQRLINSVMNTVAEGIVTLNDKHEIIMSNQEINRYWNYSLQELYKKPFVELLNLDKTPLLEQKYQQKGINDWIGKDIELIGSKKDGTTFPLELQVSSTTLDGETFFTAAIKDISERKKIELALLESKNHLEERVRNRTAELKSLNKNLEHQIQERKAIEMQLAKRAEELTQSNSDLKQFAYIASHDLKEPLRMITGYVQLLQRKYQNKLDDTANEYIAYAVEGSERSNKLLDDLLQYSNISNKDELENVDTQKIIDVVQKNLDFHIKQQNAIIRCNDLPKVQANSTQLLHVFQNLIANALKFNKSKIPIVEVRAEEQEQEYLFFIKDNGIGIEEQYKEKIFLIFQRLHSRAAYDGTGVGLAVCKKIIERHGGKIDFCSKYGEGTTFFFSLPKKKTISTI
ncbi:MAG: sensor histidine kinase [Chitinophagales bacterium]